MQASNEAGLTESNLVATEAGGQCEAYDVPPNEEFTTAEFDALELITRRPSTGCTATSGWAPRDNAHPVGRGRFLIRPTA